MNHLDRRGFLGAAGTLAAASMVNSAHAGQPDPVPIALIGCGGMGSNHLRALAGNKAVKVVAVSDVDANRLATAVKTVKDAGHDAPVAAQDFRKILDDPKIVAVWIAMPDHWHAPATILACNAGKHVYVEKPCSHNLREGRLMIEAARKNNRIVQVGTQSRSTEHIIEAMKRLHSGAIGDVLVAKAWNSQKRGNIGHKEPSDPPANLDFDAWLGPAPKRPYQTNLLPSVWRFWYDFGVGDIGNDGVHDIDIARWGLGVDKQPSTIAALGSKYFFDDDQQHADTQYCAFEWPGDGQVGHKRMLIYEQRDWSPYFQEGFENGNAYYGTNGVMILGKAGGWKMYAPRGKLIEEMSGTPDLAAHHQNFLECIKTGKRPNADIEINHLSTSLCHLGNIACRVQRTLKFDPEQEEFLDDAEADALLRRQYREGHWSVPKGV
ncbi:MAG: Gfo/Idh/MocA family oxidoreductase [Planctomycetaceae bacterium]